MQETQFDPWVRKIPWRRAWQSTSLFTPGESHGQGSLVGYDPQGCKESDTTEAAQHVCTGKVRMGGEVRLLLASRSRSVS